MPLAARSLLFVLATLAVSACVPADPLDWPISARTPRHFNEWREADLARLPPELRGEFDHAFNLFAAQTPGVTTRNMDATNNPLCRRLHGRSIRYVIVEAYQLETTALLQRISTTTDNMMTNVSRGENVTTATGQAQFAATRNRQHSAIELMEARLETIRKRITELSPPTR